MNRRDLELLSSYLDGQLKPSDSARLEARLASDPGLRAVLDDLRAARGLLRQLPMRKAPRNFTLTPKMVGKNPPLPRSYPAFRFVTALAS
jgi:anti-sigma factor RsiW